MRAFKSQAYDRELQSILANSAAKKPSKGLLKARQEIYSGINQTTPPAASLPEDILNNNKKELLKKGPFSENLTRPEVELAARRFSKHLFRDPSAISSTHFEFSQSKKYRKLLRTKNAVMSSPLPTEMHAFKTPNSFPAQEPRELNSDAQFGLHSDVGLKPISKSTRTTEKKRMNTDKVGPEKLLIVERNICKRQGLNYIVKNSTEIGPAQIKERISESNSKKFDNYATCLKIILRLLVISGISLLLLIVVLSMNSALFDFLREYFLANQLTFIFFLGGIMHSIVVGIYGLFALSKLSHIRPYFLRIPFTLIFPIGLLVTFTQYLSNVSKLMKPYLVTKRQTYLTYKDSRYIWDKLQNFFSCCGVHHSKEWQLILNSSKLGHYPRSCCIDEHPACPNFANLDMLHSDGCLSSASHFNIGLAGFITFIAVIQLALLIMSIYVMMKLYSLIRLEMQDPRSNYKIIFGKCFSICESGDYDYQQELAERGQLQFQDFVRTLPIISHSGSMSSDDAE